MNDFLDDCWSGEFKKKSPTADVFKRDICSGCKNSQCVNARGKFTLFEKRMSTQVDRLLTNPRFADPRDPRFQKISSVDFPDMARQVVALEITSRKQDWSVPTEEEVDALAEELIRSKNTTSPLHFQDSDDGGESWEVQGDSGTNYTVTRIGDSWSCTCPSRRKPCKHVQDTAQKLSRAPEMAQPTTAPEKTLPPAMPPPGPIFTPRSMNTMIPSEGIMVGKPSPPKIDPWAPPPEKPRVIPVGGKVVFGKKKT